MKDWIRRKLVMIGLVALAVLMLPFVAFSQDAAPAAEDSLSGIVAAVVGVVAFIGALVARWTQTNPDLPWYVRLSRVFDPTQIVDSTRRLDDE